MCSDDKGKEIIKQLFSQVNVPVILTDYRYEYYDCSWYWNNKLNFGEIKYRNFNSNKYDTILLEKKKYDNLMKFEDDNNIGIYYISIYEDNIYFFNLRKIIPNITTIKCPETTDFNNNEKIKKEVILLPKCQASKIIPNNFQII